MKPITMSKEQEFADRNMADSFPCNDQRARAWAEIDALRARLVEVEKERGAMSAWECATCGARFPQSVDPVFLVGVTRCSSCAVAEADRLALAASQARERELREALAPDECDVTMDGEHEPGCRSCAKRAAALSPREPADALREFSIGLVEAALSKRYLQFSQAEVLDIVNGVLGSQEGESK